ncbi:MAG: hypothetical protein ACRECW_14765 [Phyllobacterium sp.]
MPVLILQTLFLIAVAFIIGAILGWFLRRGVGSDEEAREKEAASTASAASALAEPYIAPSERKITPPETPGPPPVAPSVAAVAAMPVTVQPAKAKSSKPVTAKAKRPQTASKSAPVSGATAAAKAKPASAGSRPKATAATTATSTKAVSKPVAARAAAVQADDLKLILGLGPQSETKLKALGVTSFAQIAAWKAKDQAEFGEKLSLSGRVEREEWVKQAKALAKKPVRQPVKSASSKAEAIPAESKKAASVKPVATKASSEAGGKPSALKKARGGKPDNLTLINGIGNVIEKKLFALGIYHFDQIAQWTSGQSEWVSREIGFPGRAGRENWMKEAAILAKGGATEHSRRVEKGEVDTSHVSPKAAKPASTAKKAAPKPGKAK